jgi:aminoglycoside 6-adenylyltransferase
VYGCAGATVTRRQAAAQPPGALIAYDAMMEPDPQHAPQDRVLDRAVAWARGEDLVRALILESSRANPRAAIDELSDYDLLLVVSDVRPLRDDDAWLRWCGEPLVCCSEDWTREGLDGLTRLVLYEDGTKVDHQVWCVARFEIEKQCPALPDILDVGYRVLLDKNGVTAGLKPPTYTAHIPRRPTEREYLDLVEEFWWETTYVARNLRRGQLFPWKYSFDAVIKFDILRRMLEWHVEIHNDWSIKPGAVGRGLKDLVQSEIWAEVEATFVGPDVRDNWEALFRAGRLFRRLALDVGASLGYAYPERIERGVTAYWRRLRGPASG